MWRFRIYGIELTLVAALFLAIGFFGYLGYGLVASGTGNRPFSGEQALDFVQFQLEAGARVTGSPTNDQIKQWLSDELRADGWHVVIQEFTTANNTKAINVIARNRKENDGTPLILLGTHYNSRTFADRDPNESRRQDPVPGANSGASGTAVLLELANRINPTELEYRVCLAFFDAADNDGLEGWSAAEGSAYFVETINNIEELQSCVNPQAAIILDMVGAGPNLVFESGSNQELVRSIQQAAVTAGYTDWLNSQVSVLESGDHLPFMQAQVPTAYIFGDAYPHRYTTADSLDKISAVELEKIGRTLQTWLDEIGKVE